MRLYMLNKQLLQQKKQCFLQWHKPLNKNVCHLILSLFFGINFKATAGNFVPMCIVSSLVFETIRRFQKPNFSILCQRQVFSDYFDKGTLHVTVKN